MRREADRDHPARRIEPEPGERLRERGDGGRDRAGDVAVAILRPESTGGPCAYNPEPLAAFFDAFGWGLGMAVVARRTGIDRKPGSFGWDGGFGTSFWVDPAEELIGIQLTQGLWSAPVPPPVCADFWTAVDARDSAQAFEKAVTRSYEGSHVFFVNDGCNRTGIPSETLVKLLYPGLFMLTVYLPGARSLINNALRLAKGMRCLPLIAHALLLRGTMYLGMWRGGGSEAHSDGPRLLAESRLIPRSEQLAQAAREELPPGTEPEQAAARDARGHATDIGADRGIAHGARTEPVLFLV